MSDPRRYLDDDRADLLGRDLLRSTDGDDVEDTRADALMRVIAARTGLPVSANDALSVRPPPAPPSGPRLALLTTVALVAVGGVLLTYIETRAPSSPASSSVATVAPSVTEHPAEVPHEPPASAAVPVSLLPDAVPSAAVTPSSRSSAAHVAKAASPAASTDLAGEVRALERVRVALTEHRVTDAREGLRSYERTFPTKLLEKEARALEIEALLAEGRRDEAEALARVFLATSGDTPYATRVRSLIGAPRLP
ncbi:MAG: hypothetical protein K0S65_3214 [Labilithrix sp.]|nr:hypothetical protein [Labilithrix sp.]